MSVLVDANGERGRLVRRRHRLDVDHGDEVWDGVYIVSSDLNNEHQRIVVRLSHCFVDSVESRGLGEVSIGGNVTDREVDWAENYRCPDVAVYLGGTSSSDRGTHRLGGPDFAVEVVSKGDRSRDKFEFYAPVGTRELLLIDRYPWALELYRIDGGQLRLVGKSTAEAPWVLTSAVLPLSFRLIAGEARPTILVAHSDGARTWSA